MRGAADRCQRIGACRKSGSGVMCPSYMATREEEHATRGRANALVKALSSPDPRAAMGDERLHEILDLCLECKACKSECPLSVDMATLKSEFLAHYQDGARGAAALAAVRRDPARSTGSAPPPRRSRTCPAAARRCSSASPASTAGARCRASPARRSCAGTASAPRLGAGSRGDVVFLADSFTTFTEPAIGRAAIELLEAAGLERAARERRLLRALEHLQGPARPGARDGRGDGRAGSRPRPSAACRSSAASRRAC